MFDDDGGESIEIIADAAAALLESGPRSRDDIVVALADLQLDGHGEMVPDELLDEVISTDPRFVGVGDRVGWAPALFDGVVACHRVTAAELTHGKVSIERNLGILDWGVPPGALTVAGRPCQLRAPDLIGPDGWLDEIVPGEVLAFWRHGFDLTVERSPRLGDGGDEADALVTAAEALGTERGLELAPMMAEAIVSDPTLFRAPVPPMSELLWARGMERRRHLWGFSNWMWQPMFSDAMSGPVEILLAAFEDRARDDLSDAANLSDDAIEALLDIADSHDAESVEALRAVPTLSSPARSILDASLADRRGDPAAARAALTSVWEERHLRPVGARLAEYAMWLGELTTARSLAEAAGDPRRADACAHLAQRLDSHLRRTPRNAPCPCGSGRKFKHCCLPSGTLAATPRLAAGLVRAKLVVTVGLPASGVLGDQMVIDQARYLGLGRTRAPLLPRSEGEMFDAVMREPVRMWELASATGDDVTMRSGDVEVEVAGITGAVGDKAMARILVDQGLLYGDLEPVGADDVDAVAAALGPNPRSAQVVAALRCLE